MILSPADGVERNCRIEETRDGGATWRNVSIRLRTPWPQHMVERFFQIDTELWALLSNGDLLVTSFTALAWRQVLADVKGVTAFASLVG